MFDTTHVDRADLAHDALVDAQIDEAREASWEALAAEADTVAEEAIWGYGPEPYEPSPYDGTYSEM